mmetsp:Transcript_17379/g.52012  ORF Transcript_17379/g.52012 Transcript_17379/m.52012 type:complete len:324 (+) Transcript_17379:845-1816(+)
MAHTLSQPCCRFRLHDWRLHHHRHVSGEVPAGPQDPAVRQTARFHGVPHRQPLLLQLARAPDGPVLDCHSGAVQVGGAQAPQAHLHPRHWPPAGHHHLHRHHEHLEAVPGAPQHPNRGQGAQRPARLCRRHILSPRRLHRQDPRFGLTGVHHRPGRVYLHCEGAGSEKQVHTGAHPGDSRHRVRQRGGGSVQLLHHHRLLLPLRRQQLLRRPVPDIEPGDGSVRDGGAAGTDQGVPVHAQQCSGRHHHQRHHHPLRLQGGHLPVQSEQAGLSGVAHRLLRGGVCWRGDRPRRGRGPVPPHRALEGGLPAHCTAGSASRHRSVP